LCEPDFFTFAYSAAAPDLAARPRDCQRPDKYCAWAQLKHFGTFLADYVHIMKQN
jgi:hypothetical protein